MKISTVSIANFLTVGGDRIKLELDSKGLVLVQGENRDDSSAISNGAGKSTIADAICWCLYGVTARGESGDDVVNNKNGKDCRVSLRIVDGDSTYRITRYRKHKEEGNRLKVYHYKNHDLLAKTELTAGTDKLTQELVDKIMGASANVFCAAVYAGQEQMPNLPGMTDKFLKELIEEAAGIDRLSAAYVIAKDEHKNAKFALESALKAKGAVDKSREYNDGELKVKTDLIDNFESRRKDEVSALKIKVADAVVCLRVVEEKFKDTKLLSELRDGMAELNKEVAEIERQRNEGLKAEREATKALAKLEADMRVAGNAAKVALEAVKASEAALANVEKRIGEPCGECGKLYCEEDIGPARAIAAAEVEKAKASAKLALETYKAAKLAHDSAAERETAPSATPAALTELLSRKDAMQRQIDEVLELEREVERRREAHRLVELQAKAKSEEINPYVALVDDLMKRQKALELELEEADANVKKAERGLQLAEDTLEVFGPAGVRAHILDTVTPFLNERTAHYLTTLSDGNIQAIWNTLSRTKAGELREKFGIAVSNDKGASGFKGLSGGEKRKVRLATAMALQDLVATRATKPIDLLVCDEIDDALDNAGLERLMGLLEEKARSHGTVLVISHNSLADWCSNVMTVVKEGGFSRIEF